MKNMRTYSAKKNEVEQKWLLVDASGKVLGRVASQIAAILRGKNKAEFTPSMDVGDYVVVVNAEKIAVTGTKEKNKKYFRYTGYAGGIKEQTVSQVRDKHPERILMYAVKGMLPKGPIGDKMLKKLKLTVGSNHKYSAQKPQLIEIL